MPLISLVIALIVVGVALYLINRFIPILADDSRCQAQDRMHEVPPESVTKPQPRDPVRNLPWRTQISPPGDA